MKSIYVADLQKGMQINGETFAVQESKYLETKDKKPYYKVMLIDKTGSISGQIWSNNIPNVERKALKPGKVVIIDARVEDYKGKLQLNITTVNSVDETALDEYMEASELNLDDLWTDLMGYIDQIKEVSLKELLKEILSHEDIGRLYKVGPAAEYVHHSFRGGLLEHVVEMLDLAHPMKKYYSDVNYDLVYAGIILHDIGKLFELNTVGAVVQRTKEGYLIGHLIQSYEILIKFGKEKLNAETLINLKHIILAHHGIREYGSPVIPATIEAAIVHSVDEASTKVRIFQKVMKKGNQSEEGFFEWDNILKTRVYQTPQIKE